MTETSWDHSVDVLIVGSGNGALTAALSSYEMGVTDVLIVEKSAKIGGTSATSGGGVWIPCNRYAKAAGAQDSFDDAKAYLLNTTPPGAVPEEMIDSYLRNGPKMIDFLHERSDVRYETLEHYSQSMSRQSSAEFFDAKSTQRIDA